MAFICQLNVCVLTKYHEQDIGNVSTYRNDNEELKWNELNLAKL